MTPPTDLELMTYFDGELVDDARREVVAKHVAGSKEAASKLRALEAAAEIIAARAAKATGGDGIAAAVMTSIAKGASAAPSDLELMMHFDGELGPDRGEVVAAHLVTSADAAAKVRALRFGGEILARHAANTSVAADRIADAVMAVVAEEAARQDDLGVAARSSSAAPAARVAARAPAANDNAKRIYAAALLAVAAAAALLVWGRSAPELDVATNPAPSADVAPSAVAAAPPSVAPTPSASPTAEDDSEPEAVHGVEVAAVEFGGRMGSIFYVPSGTEGSGTTTTVVWLGDDAGDE